MEVPKDFNEKLAKVIKQGIHDIYHGSSWNPLRYMELHNNVVNYYKRSSLDEYKQCYNQLTEWIKELIVGVLEKLDAVVGEEEFLAFYMEKWEWFKAGSKMLNGVYNYVNRASKPYGWIVNGRFNDALENLTIFLWKKIVLKRMLSKLTGIILTLIEQHRNGGNINYKLIHAYMYHFEHMNGSAKMMDGYKIHFEEFFLQETALYYKTEPFAILKHPSEIERLRQTEKFFKREERLVRFCLHGSTMARLIDLCEDILIRQKLDWLCEQFTYALRCNDMKILRIIHSFVVRWEHGFREILGRFQYHYRSHFDALLNDEVAQKNVDVALEIIFDAHRNYSNLIAAVFSNDPRFFENLDKYTLFFIASVLTAKDEPPELFAYYLDSLMRNTRKKLEDEELEEYLTHAMRLLTHIEDKGAFEKAYHKLFSTRLVTYGPTSETAEVLMIKKIKRVLNLTDHDSSGPKKYQQMHRDLELSEGLPEDFKNHLDAKNYAIGLDFGVQVLHSFHWSLNDPGSFRLPFEMEQCAIKFTEYYKMKFGKRTLLWQHHLSKGEIQANCYGISYKFQASAYQMTVLLMFNSKDSYPIGELVEETEIKKDILVPVVESLIKVKLLILADGNPKESLTPDSVVKFCEEYRNKKRRVNIRPQPNKFQVVTDAEEV
ncbi:unnamed protein product [Orchesella dallaii]|uniref:Cullin family profile domain-containing protein n=1 Tax=Orchesella dallaii TaxID=48710 RepID=A0ABP1QJ73_9HEXA